MSDELGFNKIAGAILATALAFIGIRELAHAAYHPHMPETPAYGAEMLEAAMSASAAGAVEEIPLPFPQADYVAAMDAAAGAKVFSKCKSCHTIEQGGANGTGPNLYGILGNPAAALDGFAYSTAFQESGVTWGYEEMDAFLAKPKSYIKGTAMGFVGLKKEEQRAAMIAYLRSYGDEDIPLPTPAPSREELEAAAAPAAPADGAVTVDGDITDAAPMDAPMDAPE